MVESDKRKMSEAQLRYHYINGVLEAKWEKSRIVPEYKITDGQVSLKGKPHREKPKFADYVLFYDRHLPLAIVEAKDATHSASYGLQQAKVYAEMMQVPFVYSTNGEAFVEFDMLTGVERTLAPEDFPTAEELWARYRQAKGWTDEQERCIRQPYYFSQKVHTPRYYQQNAINLTMEAIARGQKRLLLVMATGTGKTYTAFQIVYRLLKSGLRHKVLYLADRNILVDQTIQQDFAPFEKVIHKIQVAKEDPATISSHEVYFGLYQQLFGDDGEEHFRTLFKEDFFDLIVVDECHRSSANEAKRWHRILEYFSSATQIGLTATPKETNDVSNLSYFDEPVYTYSLDNGIKDGFLAPFKVHNVLLNIADGWRPTRGQCDIYGTPIPDQIYLTSDYDYKIVLQDRIDEVAREITKHLHKIGRMSKTIVFCATEDAAERMRTALSNLNADMMREHPDYVVRITGSDTYGQGKLDYFISATAPYPVIATTSKLLATGVDCKTVKLIVLDQNIGSMTEFKQIIGRGTRLREDLGKTHFTVMDFRGVTRLFADPKWDGPIEVSDGYTANTIREPPDDPPYGDEPDIPEPKPKAPLCVIDRDGCKVEIVYKTVSIYDPEYKLLRQEKLIDYSRRNVLELYKSQDGFTHTWDEAEQKQTIQETLSALGIDLEALKEEEGMLDVDDYDYICHLAFDAKPLTRKERANNVKKRDFLNKYTGIARTILEALIDKYAELGIYEIEKTDILELHPFMRYGKKARIMQAFGGREAYLQALHELQHELYSVA